MDNNGSFIGDDNLFDQGRLSFKLSQCLGKKRGPSVSTLIIKELREVAKQVKAEIHDLCLVVSLPVRPAAWSKRADTVQQRP